MNIHRMPPESIVIAVEAASCKGCIYEQGVRLCGDVRMMCLKGKRHGTRCRRYKAINRGCNG